MYEQLRLTFFYNKQTFKVHKITKADNQQTHTKQHPPRKTKKTKINKKQLTQTEKEKKKIPTPMKVRNRYILKLLSP